MNCQFSARSVLLFVLIAAFASAVPVFSEETIHVFQQGETVYSLARVYGVSPSAILSLNGLSEADARKIQPGRRLRIPGTQTGSSSSWEEYQIQKGDTLYSLAQRYTISLNDLLKLNGFPAGYNALREGQKIKVPSGTPPSVVSGNGKTPAKAAVDPAVRWPIRAKDISYFTGKLFGITATGERYEPVKSLTKGTVVQAGPYRGFGKVVFIRADDYLYVYGGCESLSVKEGDRVTPGAEVGKLGIDKKTDNPQLFFLVFRNNNPVDPAKAPRG